MEFQRATWRVERAGWISLCIFVALALIGLFSNGPISSATATDATGRLQVEYGRFQRFGAPSTLRLTLSAGPEAKANVHISNSFIEAFTIEGIMPEPTGQRGSPKGTELTFQTSDRAAVDVFLVVRPEAVGLVESELSVVGESTVHLTQFVFP